MKAFLFLKASTITLCIYSCSIENKGYTIKGDIEHVGNGQAILMHLNLTDNETVYVDTTAVTNGQFEFTGQLDHPYFYTVKINDTIAKYFFLENSDITLTGTADSIIVSGSSEDSLLSSYVFADIFEKDIAMDIILNHSDTHVAAFAAFYQLQISTFPSDTLDMIMNIFSPEVKQSEYYAQLDSLYQTLKTVAIGNIAPNIAIPDTEGNLISLHDHRGDYILLEFWASWCAPCRQEIPGLLSIYHRYQDRGFKVIAISVDKDRQGWLNAIDKDELDWINLSNCAGWDAQSKSYGIKSIPQNFLLDPTGKIIGRNMKKDALEEMLKEVYGNNK